MTDRPLAPDIEAVRRLIDDGTILAAARSAGANP
jgi:histidine ammonia-lyase